MKNCKNIKSLPNGEMEMMMMMISLKELCITGCPTLGCIQPSIRKCTSLESLKRLEVLNMFDLEELVKDEEGNHEPCISSQTNPFTFNFIKRRDIKHMAKTIPEWIGNLLSLQRLELWCCKELKYLPSKEGMLCLSKLHLLKI
ncbi:Protein E6 [Bienertia sinuspersici]